MTHQRLTKKMKEARRRINGEAVAAIYDRAVQGGSEGYLATRLPSDPLAVARALEQAITRRKAKNAKRLANWNGREGADPCTDACNHLKEAASA